MQPLREQGIEGSFDVICLRNVIKYLTEEGRERALTTTSNVLQRRGILILGSEKHEGKSVLKEIEQFGFSKSRWYTPECPMYVRA